MQILAVNTKNKHIGNAPNERLDQIPNKGDSMLFKHKHYKVISRYFQYYGDDLEIVNIYVRPSRWWDRCL